MPEPDQIESLRLSSIQRAPTAVTLFDASPVQKDILKVLAYFDIFGHPLTKNEIFQYLPSNSTSIQEIALACNSTPLTKLVACHEEYYFLQTQSFRIVEERKHKEHQAERMLKLARYFTLIFKRVPFVRGIYVTGELSKGIATNHSDIDLLIITAPKRLWMCRSIFPFLKRILLLNVKQIFCFNTFISEDRLTSDVKNLYVALEIATIKPLFNSLLYNNYLHANNWINQYLPNLSIQKESAQTPSELRSFFKTTLELLFQYSVFDRFDAWLMRRWEKIWSIRFRTIDADVRSRLFQCKPHLSTYYNKDHFGRIFMEYEKRLSDLGLMHND